MLLEIETTNVVAKLETETPRYEVGVLDLSEWLKEEFNIRGVSLNAPQRIRNQGEFIKQVTQSPLSRSLRSIMSVAAQCHISFQVAVEILQQLNKGRRGWFLEVQPTSQFKNDTSVRLYFKRIAQAQATSIIKDTSTITTEELVKDLERVERIIEEESSAYSRHNPNRNKPIIREWQPTPESELEWTRLKAVMEAYEDDRFMIALGGDPSIGKTWLAQHHALGGRECYNVTLNEDSYAGELKGYVVKDKDGSFIWCDGPGTRAFRNGGRIVINEIQRAPANVLSYFLELTESRDSAMISLPPPSNETLRQHPKFQVIASYNGEFEDMPEALKSRFTTNIHLKSANPDAIKGLPNHLRKIAATSVVCEDLVRRISLRHWYDFVDKLKKGLPESIAAWSVFGDQAEEILNQIKLSR